MRGPWRWALVVVVCASFACKKDAPRAEGGGDGGVTAAPEPVRAAEGAPPSSEIFSAPIAGARAEGGDVLAAGLVVAEQAIFGARVNAAGKALWARKLVADVKWSADAELHAWPIVAGAVVVWRGLVGGKSRHVAVALRPDGRVIEGPFDVGPLLCATDDGLAWSEPAGGDGTRVRLRTWAADGGAHEDIGAPVHDELTLTCGSHRAYALVEGDEETPTRVFSVGQGAGPAPLVTIPPLALGKDEERDLLPWAEGEDLGLVRISSGGAVEAADVRGGEWAPLRGDRGRVPPEDDVVALDADARQVVLVTTRDESDACPDGRGGSSVRVLRFARGGAPAAGGVVELAKGGCRTDVGPFWSSPVGGSVVLGWVERASRPEKTSAPITGFGYRVLADGETTKHVAQPADAIADAGCDAKRCYAVALVREAGADGGRPEAMRVLAYP